MPLLKRPQRVLLLLLPCEDTMRGWQHGRGLSPELDHAETPIQTSGSGTRNKYTNIFKVEELH